MDSFNNQLNYSFILRSVITDEDNYSMIIIPGLRTHSPLLCGNDEQVVEEEEEDRGEFGAQVEHNTPFGHLLQLTTFFQETGLGNNWDGLKREGVEGGRTRGKAVQEGIESMRYINTIERLMLASNIFECVSTHLEFVKLQCFGEVDKFLHLLHLPHLGVALLYDLVSA